MDGFLCGVIVASLVLLLYTWAEDRAFFFSPLFRLRIFILISSFVEGGQSHGRAPSLSSAGKIKVVTTRRYSLDLITVFKGPVLGTNIF